MKIKRKRQLEAKRAAIAAGTNNGWLNFSLPITCRGCDSSDTGDYCQHLGYNLTTEKGCTKRSLRGEEDSMTKEELETKLKEAGMDKTVDDLLALSEDQLLILLGGLAEQMPELTGLPMEKLFSKKVEKPDDDLGRD